VDEVWLWRSVAAALFILLVGFVILARVTVWRMYAGVRDERDTLERRLDAMSARATEGSFGFKQRIDILVEQRDGFQRVAERALFVAQLARDATERAARVAAHTVGAP
jgi:hypothetical protein